MKNRISAVSIVPATKIHSSLSPRTNVLLICTWAVVAVFAFFVLSPHLPFGLGIVGGLLGAAAGACQHLSLKQNPKGFLLVKTPLFRVVLGYAVAYISFMLIRDILTLKDTFTLRTLRDGRTTPEAAG